MKKIIRLTESDLVRLVKRVIIEEIKDDNLLSNIKTELVNLGFIYKDEDYRHVLKYKKGENSITVSISKQPGISKPYSVVSILLKPNYEAHPGYEKSKWDMTYTDIDKNYSADQYKLLLNDVKTSMKKIKPTA